MKLTVRRLGLQDYSTIWHQMQAFTNQRDDQSADEIWLTEHPAVYTQGVSGKVEHLIKPGASPVVQSDRGGQVTYHGPGQLIVYTLINLHRKKIGIRTLVTQIEQSLIDLLQQYGLSVHARKEAPGVYLENAKIASLGLRIRKGCSYHGLSLNVDMDLTPFEGINPCGFPALPITQLSDQVGAIAVDEVTPPLIAALMQQLDYQTLVRYEDGVN